MSSAIVRSTVSNCDRRRPPLVGGERLDVLRLVLEEPLKRRLVDRVRGDPEAELLYPARVR